MFNILSGRGLIALLMISSWLNATASKEGEGYRIEIQIVDIPDSVCYLANYYGDKTYLVDTAFVNESGKFIFEGDSLLQGVFILLLVKAITSILS